MTWHPIYFVAGGVALMVGGVPAFVGLLVGVAVDMCVNAE